MNGNKFSRTFEYGQFSYYVMLFGVLFPTGGGGYMTEKNNFIRRETLTIIHVWVLHSIMREFTSFSVYVTEGLCFYHLS